MSEKYLYVFIVMWWSAGLGFWFACLRWHGLPDRWSFSRHHREPNGWLDWLVIHLIVCLIGGPLWWPALAYCRWRQKRTTSPNPLQAERRES